MSSQYTVSHTIFRTQGPVRFKYIPIINRLRSMLASRYLGPKLRYREIRTNDLKKSEDVFDGRHFSQLLEKDVTWAGKTSSAHGGKYFDQPTDLAFGLSTDGIPLHKRSPLDTWPLLLTIYSLPPEIRYRREFQLCCGLIPGERFASRDLPRSH